MALAVLVAIGLLVFISVTALKKKADYRKTKKQYKEMLSVSKEFLRLREKVSMVEARAGLSESRQLPVVVEKVVADMGLKQKLQSVKPFGGGARTGYNVQEAEVAMDNLTLNELINVLYGIYHAPAGLFVTSAEFKRDFSAHELIDAKMSLKLVEFSGKKGS